MCRLTCPWSPQRSPAVERRTPPSPAERPGAIADQLCADFDALGYPLHTSGSDRAAPALIECYPHIEHLAGRTVGLGDDTAAIWVPQSLVKN